MAHIIFVDENDNQIGIGSKQEAWKTGVRHRVSRIFLFNSKGEMLIQKRADNRESLPGRWDQSAAGHVDEGESYLEAANREMNEEVGVQGVVLKEVGKNKTDERDEQDKIKNRYAMLYVASYDRPVNFNQEEVSEVRWIKPDDLSKWMEEKPEEFTEGFILNFRKLLELNVMP